MIEGFRHFPGYLGRSEQERLVTILRKIIQEAPLYAPAMPRSGKLLSVLMTNCGPLGWLTDKEGGYRYQTKHPETDRPWPPIPDDLQRLWVAVSDCPLEPEACLINYYSATARLGSHRDEDEEEKSAPVVSVSLGDDAVFHVGGLRRSDPKERLMLRSGDVVVLGGKARLAYHGIDRVHPGTSDLLAEGGRINVTLRRVHRRAA